MNWDKIERDYGFPTACLSMTSYCVLWSGWFNSIILQQTNHSLGALKTFKEKYNAK